MACLCLRFDHRDQQVIRAYIEQLLDQNRIVRGRAHNRGHVIGRNRLKLAQNGAQIDGGMFPVQQQEIKICPGADFGAVMVG